MEGDYASDSSEILAKGFKGSAAGGEVGEHLPSLHPPLPTLRLPNDRLVLALGDFGLGLSQAADGEEGRVCKTDRTLHARERRKKKFFFYKQSLGNFLFLSRFIQF